MGRFINADSYLSTGQGLVGNNMYSYCCNDPINLVDLYGFSGIWYYLFRDSQFGFIHNLVELHISSHSNRILVSELVIYSGAARADLVDSNTGEVWEIKSGAGPGPTARALLAQTQARSYIGGKGKRNNMPITITQLGSENAFEGKFTISCMDKTYLVTYETPAAGVILYYVTDTSYQENVNYSYQPVYLEDYHMNLSSMHTLSIPSPNNSFGKNIIGCTLLACGASFVMKNFNDL